MKPQFFYVLLLLFICFGLGVQAFAKEKCSYDSALLNLPLTPEKLTGICNSIISSDLCKKEPPEKLLNCSKPELVNETDLWDLLVGCSKGLFASVEQTLKFIEDILKWAWDNAFSEEELKKVGQQGQEYSQILKLYLYTEYEKAYAIQDPPLKKLKALKAMGGVISKLILGRIEELISKEKQKLSCYNFQAKWAEYCKAVGDIFVSHEAAISFIKSGRVLLQEAKKPAIKIANALDSKSRQIRRISPLSLPENKSIIDRKGYELSPSQISYSRLTPLDNRPRSAVENQLMSSAIGSSEKISLGANSAKLVTLRDGTKAIWKTHKELWHSNYRAEVLAYEIDKKFGFNLVPPTVERKHNGKIGSLQLYKPSIKPVKDGEHLVQVRRDEVNKQSLFDYLIDNRDRHAANVLIDRRGKVISIDNGDSFTGKGKYIRPFESRVDEISRFLSTTEGNKIMRKLKEADLNDLEKQVGEYIGKGDAEKFKKRIEFIIKFYDNSNL